MNKFDQLKDKIKAKYPPLTGPAKLKAIFLGYQKVEVMEGFDDEVGQFRQSAVCVKYKGSWRLLYFGRLK